MVDVALDPSLFAYVFFATGRSAQVWGLDEVHATDRVHVYILRLRKKIGEDYIRTVRGVGYILEDPTHHA